MQTMLKLTVQGMDDLQKQQRRIERGVAAMDRYDAYVYSSLPYAYGAEHGHHQEGKLARRSGGTYYMRRAVTEVLGDADRDLNEGLKKVTAPGPWVLRRLGLWSRRLARNYAPRGGKKRQKYRLFRSIKYRVEKR